MPFTTEEIRKLWEDNEPWQRACANFLGEINCNYPKSDRLSLLKKTSRILPRIVHDAAVTGARIFYSDANKSGKAGYKLEELNKVE